MWVGKPIPLSKLLQIIFNLTRLIMMTNANVQTLTGYKEKINSAKFSIKGLYKHV